MALKPLPFDKLRLRTDPGKLPFESTADLPDSDMPPGQERAMRALAFGGGMQGAGYNLYISGVKGTGRHRTVFEALSRIAKTKPAPPEWCYVRNCAQPDKPLALHLAAGEGARFRDAMRQFAESLDTLQEDVRMGANYRSQKAEIDGAFYRTRDAALDALRKGAERHGLLLAEPRAGRFEFRPQSNGLPLTDAEYRALDRAERDRIQARRRALRHVLRSTLEGLSDLRVQHNANLGELETKLAAAAIAQRAEELLGRFRTEDKTAAYIDTLARNAAAILNHSPQTQSDIGSRSRTLCHVELLVHEQQTASAPVIWLMAPTVARLTGWAESSGDTGFRVHPGALHHANGGFLLIEALALLQQRPVWTSLKEALRSGQIAPASGSSVCDEHSVEIMPEPIPLDCKIVLFGEPWIFDRLRALDQDFRELFKAQVEFTSIAARDDACCTALLRAIARQARRDGTRQLDRGAAARLIDEASRQAGDSDKISVRADRLYDLSREANVFAEQAGSVFIRAQDIECALDAREDRAGRLKALEQELVRRRIIFIDTDSAEAGQVNALTVLNAGAGPFGVPARVTATVGSGATPGITLDRIVNHTASPQRRGMQILAGYLTGTYSKLTPLSLSASVAFEQCYGPVDGDSASAAELMAVLSAIAGIPLRQSIGVTGAVNLRGMLQPVGNVNQKIEGFFDICMMRGLSPKHGVIIPMANISNLMLREDLCDAARRGLFSIYPVEHIAEALEILSGIRAGALRGARGFPRNSFNRRVVNALREMARPRILRPVNLDSWLA